LVGCWLHGFELTVGKPALCIHIIWKGGGPELCTYVTDVREFGTEVGGSTDSCYVTMSGVLETNGSSVNDAAEIVLLATTSLAQTAGVSLRIVLIGGALAMVPPFLWVTSEVALLLAETAGTT